MGALRTLDDLDLAELGGRRVLVRVDFNVPIREGRVSDPSRIEASLPTLRELSDAGGRLLLVSHRGRPQGKPDPELSLEPVAEALGELTGRPVRFAPDCVGPAAEGAAESLEAGELALLENLRFHPGERGNDSGFAAALAGLADTYVNDAFGAAHRAHASIVGVAAKTERRAAGRLLAGEVAALGRLLGEVEEPFAAVLGGAKVSGKMDTLAHLLPRLDRLLLGGGMANTFLAAGGYDLADSLVEEAGLAQAREILIQAEESSVEVFLPVDLVVAEGPEETATIQTVPVGELAPGTAALDIGEGSRRAFAEALTGVRTLFWNGPLGVFERPPFDAGTRAVAEALAEIDAYTLIGGGETVAAARQAGVTARIDHVSTGGGASLEFLAGKSLPGVAALEANG